MCVYSTVKLLNSANYFKATLQLKEYTVGTSGFIFFATLAQYSNPRDDVTKLLVHTINSAPKDLEWHKILNIEFTLNLTSTRVHITLCTILNSWGPTSLYTVL